ncbi:hypothetical protein DNHGIG_26510 [Collibacillus ludicampi]|uniref:Glycosyltransferase 2-like domain-containing protein n=1 Tax=Collibacillus ludicampi TaxID=2771369 RepID=A0AAV4LH05_9BACL|nr:hypothetical protein [Collibacillus ludicampi]GIM47102.1 hypothetical protein DNHGIG_26510 [Collibacillus ludicampi]
MDAEKGKLNKVVGVIFSKDRAMQLDATIRSLMLHCRDHQQLVLKVLYTTSNPYMENQYHELIRTYDTVEFIKEHEFKSELLSSVADYPYVLFLVDDNLFVRDFSVMDLIHSLETHHDVLGFSLRLGNNTDYCYPLARKQKLPAFLAVDHGFLKYNWTQAEYDFAYPLEVSSSLYRVDDILPLLIQTEFSNPNTLESGLAAYANRFVSQKNFIMCNQQSITFCNPLNVVQNVFHNRAGNRSHYSVHELRKMFDQGFRIDVERYSGFVPNACHQEIDLYFKRML